jgi:elongation factor Ts
MQISAAAVKQLRDRTNAPMMDCKEALAEAQGDMEKAVEVLAKKNKLIAAKREGKETAEGRIGVYIDPAQKVGAIIEVRCESAPVAKSEQFIALVNELAKQVALKTPGTVQDLLAQPLHNNPSKTVNDRIGEVIGIIRENMKPVRFVRMTGQLGSYVHHDGTVGVLVQVEGPNAEPQLLRDISMHITAKNPLVGTASEISPERIEKEKEIAQAQIREDPKNASKPANIIAKIAEGKLKTWIAENVLVEQPFVKDDSKTVGALLSGAGLKLGKFARLQVGQIVS